MIINSERLIMSIHNLVIEAIETDDINRDKYTQSIIFKYKKLNDDEKYHIDLIFIGLTGYSLSHFIEETTK